MNICVIGAGLSGLYAAYLLKNEGFEVKVLEASDKAGGRIRTLQGFAEAPVELGAEYIHGQYSLFYNYVEYLGTAYAVQKGKSYLYHNGRVRNLKKLARENNHIKKALKFFDKQWKYRGEEVTVETYLARQEWYPEARDLMEVFAAEFGTSNQRLGMRSLAINESRWTSGNKDFKAKAGLYSTLQEFLDCLADDIQYNTPVVTVDYAAGKPLVEDLAGNLYRPDVVLITVPLGILKEGSLKFQPELPVAKRHAITTLGIDNVIKVVMKFKKSFWKKKMFELYGGRVCPLYYVPWTRTEDTENLLVGYITGEKAEQMQQTRNNSIEPVVNELDTMFGQKIASANLEKYAFMDWGSEQYIKGGYSYDTPLSEGLREELARPVGGTVFFAGEATEFNGHNATLQGAMHSAERAVNEIMELIGTD